MWGNVDQAFSFANKNKLINTNNRMLVSRREEVAERVNWVKGVKYMVTVGNQTLGGEHAIQYTDAEL